ncbi:MAG: uncharacterized protein KVP18_003864 [Porospora cf. gigantea A]|uniref:uncharacterized protein n=1 Tax=Porospora cf. gigantea A TaxID=2853593 RepID=UPI0035595595|nr:MAG: hypothetical protein KVP18_003864 [Porospora cf. gigantea A]
MFNLTNGAIVTSAASACWSLFLTYQLQVQAYESVVMFVLVVGGLAATYLAAAAGICICLLGLPKLLLGPIIMTMVSTLMWTAAFSLQTLRSRDDCSMEILLVLAIQVLDFDAKQSLRNQVIVSA